jgi:hypothetical protein
MSGTTLSWVRFQREARAALISGLDSPLSIAIALAAAKIIWTTNRILI